MSKTCTSCGNSGITVSTKKMDDGSQKTVCTDCWVIENPKGAQGVKMGYKIRNGLLIFAGAVATIWAIVSILANM